MLVTADAASAPETDHAGCVRALTEHAAALREAEAAEKAAEKALEAKGRREQREREEAAAAREREQAARQREAERAADEARRAAEMCNLPPRPSGSRGHDLLGGDVLPYRAPDVRVSALRFNFQLTPSSPCGPPASAFRLAPAPPRGNRLGALGVQLSTSHAGPGS